MINKDRLTEYVEGMLSQQIDAQKQVDMLEGAIQFARQLISELDESEEGEGETSPESDEPDESEDD